VIILQQSSSTNSTMSLMSHSSTEMLSTHKYAVVVLLLTRYFTDLEYLNLEKSKLPIDLIKSKYFHSRVQIK